MHPPAQNSVLAYPPRIAGAGGGGGTAAENLDWTEITGDTVDGLTQGSADGYVDSLVYGSGRWVASWALGGSPTATRNDAPLLIAPYEIPLEDLVPNFDLTRNRLWLRLQVEDSWLTATQDRCAAALGVFDSAAGRAVGVAIEDYSTAGRTYFTSFTGTNSSLRTQYITADVTDQINAYQHLDAVNGENAFKGPCFSTEDGAKAEENMSDGGNGYTSVLANLFVTLGCLKFGTASVVGGTQTQFRCYYAVADIPALP